MHHIYLLVFFFVTFLNNRSTFFTICLILLPVFGQLRENRTGPLVLLGFPLTWSQSNYSSIQPCYSVQCVISQSLLLCNSAFCLTSVLKCSWGSPYYKLSHDFQIVMDHFQQEHSFRIFSLVSFCHIWIIYRPFHVPYVPFMYFFLNFPDCRHHVFTSINIAFNVLPVKHLTVKGFLALSPFSMYLLSFKQFMSRERP